MAAAKDLDNFLKTYRQVADRIRRLEFEAKVARITLEDITTTLGVELSGVKSVKKQRKQSKARS